MQKDFIDIAAHELRNPIQPILSITEVLKRTAKDAQEYEFISIISRNARRLKLLTEDILDVSRIESNSLQLNRQHFNLSDMILDCITDFRNQIKNYNRDSNLKLEVLFSSDEGAKTNKEDVFIEADRNRLYQVVSNLLSNTIKFTKEGIIVVSIEIRAREKTMNSDNDEGGVDVVISVKDTGVGIDSEVLSRLFMKFTTKSETGGNGLGLFISKNIVEAHGGRIWAKNNNDGKGATFSFSLPIVNK